MLEIKEWYVIDDFDVKKGPPNPHDFSLELRVDVGEFDDEAVSNYQIFVCTPLGLISRFNEIVEYAAMDSKAPRTYMFGKGLLLVPNYDIRLILKAINDSLEDLEDYAFDMT